LDEEWKELIMHRCEEIALGNSNHSILRDPSVLTPLVTYFSLLLGDISIDLKEFLEVLPCHQEKVEACIYEIAGTDSSDLLPCFKERFKEYERVSGSLSFCPLCGADNDALLGLIFSTNPVLIEKKHRLLALIDHVSAGSPSHLRVKAGLLCCRCHAQFFLPQNRRAF